MAVYYGFFDSIDGDRKYKAEDFNQFFDGFVSEGVLGPVGDWFQVTPSSGMNVSVGSGKAWFLTTWISNTSSRIVQIAAADPTYPRVDTVVLDFNMTSRENSIRVLTGTPDAFPVNPTRIETDNRRQVPLCDIWVSPGVSTIITSNITNRIGTVSCPFATGLLQQASTSDLLIQWRQEFNEWMGGVENDLAEIDTTGTLEELEDIRQKHQFGRNILINGDMRVNQRGNYLGEIVAVNASSFGVEDGYTVADRWRLRMGNTNSGDWDTERVHLGNGLYSYKAKVTNTTAATDPNCNMILQQHISPDRFGDAHKGTFDTKPRDLTLSWKFKTNRGGTYIIELRDTLNDRMISHSVYHDGDGTFKEFTWHIVPDYFDPLDLDDGDTGMTLNFWLLAGSVFTSGTSLNEVWSAAPSNRRAVGQVNLGAILNNYYEITDVQLEIGSIPTVYERQPLDVQLQECQYYYEYIDSVTLPGFVEDDGNLMNLYFYDIVYRTRKRKSTNIPAIRLSGMLSWIPGSQEAPVLTISPLVSIMRPDAESRSDRTGLIVTGSTTRTHKDWIIAKLTDIEIDAEML